MSYQHGLDSGGCPIDDEPEHQAVRTPLRAARTFTRITPDQRRLLERARACDGIVKGDCLSGDWCRLDALVDRGLLQRRLDRRNTHDITQLGIAALEGEPA